MKAGAMATAVFLVSMAANAQTYPAKPVRMIVGYAPGGGVDTGARLVASALGDLWGSSVIVDNRPGATGTIASDVAAKAAPDGYTLLLCQIASHSINPARHKNLPFDHIKDFAPISMVGTTPNLLVVNVSLPAKTLGEFIAHARANPGKLNYGSSGVGASPHMSMELLIMMTGIKLVHVPYKGAALALTDVMGGQMHAMIGNLPGGPLAAAKSGKVHPLAVTSGKRSPQLPEVPTIAESGVPGYEVVSWYGICAPSAVPRPILAKLNSDLVKVLGQPDLHKRLADQGIDAASSTAEAFASYIKAETVRWAKVVKDSGMTAE